MNTNPPLSARRSEPRIHVWVPDYASAIGGIQTFSRFLVRALREVYPESHIMVISKNDTTFPDMERDPADKFVLLGWWKSSLRTAAFTVELFRQAVRARPDLIIVGHVNFAPAAQLLRALFNIPYCAVGYGIDVWQIPSKSVKQALRAANQLMAISEFTREKMALEIAVDMSAISLLPCTFDPADYTPGPKPHFLLKRYGLREDQPVILTVSRLASAERYKGYDQILKALPTVRQRLPDVCYIIGGRGPDRDRIISLIVSLGVEKNVIMAGYIPDHELKPHYNVCDVFAMPSKGEGFGIVFLEAAACGKPVIAGNKDGSVDAVLNGETGILIDPDDVPAISDALIRVLSERNSENAVRTEEQRHRVINRFGYKRFVEIVRKLFGPLLSAGTRSA